jgi:tetratricopeptide (TPR) repeat protein
MIATHLDEFLLLRLAAGDLSPEERDQALDHLETCSACSRTMSEIEALDSVLTSAARDGDLAADPDEMPLEAADPFARRPEPPAQPRRGAPAPDLFAAVNASRESAELEERLLEATGEPRSIAEVLHALDLSAIRDRFALLYALQKAGARIAEGPVRMLRFAEATLQRLRERETAERPDAGADRIVPALILVGQAHALAGQACNWTSEFQRAASYLQIAYRSFGRAGDEIALATVEHLESQRRYFLDRYGEALTLSRRALRTFREFGLDDMAARAGVGVANALSRLGRDDEAVALFREAAATFEGRGLWSNYINAMNNMGASLQRAGRLDEARREYARALRGFPRSEFRSLAFLRHGLAEILFSAGKYREAAIAVSRTIRLYADLGLSARALTASLLEIESWARAGELTRARHRLEIFQEEIARQEGLDPGVTQEIARALSGTQPDFERVATLRREADGRLQEYFQGRSA